MTRQFSVPEGAAGERLDVFLAANLGISRSHAQRLIRTGLTLVGALPQKTGYALIKNDHITVNDPLATTLASQPVDLPIRFEDDDLLVVEKPPGLVVHHGAGTAGLPTVAGFARLHSSDPDPDRPGIVHRLDRDTSGLLIIAKNIESKSFLQSAFATRSVKKTYLALLVGRLLPPDAIIRLPLDRDPAKPTQRAVSPSGRPAETRYHTVALFEGYTLVEATPLTGRTHQLRVHFASVGHPVAGDTVYGSTRRPLGLARQFLHATSLQFTGPSGAVIHVTSALPADLERVVQALGGSGIIGG